MLALPDGQKVYLGDPTPGGSKNDTRYGTLDSGQTVVVKIQAHHGQLSREVTALTFAATQDLPVPTVIASGTTEVGGSFLVLTKEPGARPTTSEGWQRMGRDYARLATIVNDACPLPIIQGHDFGADHDQRLRAVKHLLPEQTHDQIGQAIAHLANSRCLALTHGDPGSGNYLDGPTGGTILDWETATVAPFGLDAGRASFIALLDLGHTGVPEQLQAAFIHGYRAALPAERTLSDETLHASTLIAGLQFTHGRHTRPLRPDRTPQMVIDTMQTYLKAR